MDHEGDAGMAGDSQVPATAPAALPTQAVTVADADEPNSTQATDIAAMRAAADAANAGAAAAVAQLSELKQLSAARDAELAVVRQQLELAQNPPPSQPDPALPAEDSESAARADHTRSSRSRSADRRRRAAKEDKPK